MRNTSYVMLYSMRFLTYHASCITHHNDGCGLLGYPRPSAWSRCAGQTKRPWVGAHGLAGSGHRRIGALPPGLLAAAPISMRLLSKLLSSAIHHTSQHKLGLIVHHSGGDCQVRQIRRLLYGCASYLCRAISAAGSFGSREHETTRRIWAGPTPGLPRQRSLGTSLGFATRQM